MRLIQKVPPNSTNMLQACSDVSHDVTHIVSAVISGGSIPITALQGALSL